MRGRILNYSVQANEGTITGEDGFRYTFSGSEWREADTPTRGSAVDFDVSGASAIGVYNARDGASTSATPHRIAPQRHTHRARAGVGVFGAG